jgi:hypothetical protein
MPDHGRTSPESQDFLRQRGWFTDGPPRLSRCPCFEVLPAAWRLPRVLLPLQLERIPRQRRVRLALLPSVGLARCRPHASQARMSASACCNAAATAGRCASQSSNAECSLSCFALRRRACSGPRPGGLQCGHVVSAGASSAGERPHGLVRHGPARAGPALPAAAWWAPQPGTAAPPRRRRAAPLPACSSRW